jgi:hypothetical protein
VPVIQCSACSRARHGIVLTDLLRVISTKMVVTIVQCKICKLKTWELTNNRAAAVRAIGSAARGSQRLLLPEEEQAAAAEDPAWP